MLLEPSDSTTFSFTSVLLDATGQPIQQLSGSIDGWVEALADGVALEMVRIPSGTFVMGAPVQEEGCTRSQIPQHAVAVPAFGMGRFLVTQAQWRAVAALPKVDRPLEPEPSTRQDDLRPVDQVSWQDAAEFCARLTQYTGRSYRLTSEAEWEYACRAGTETPFHFGPTITTEFANYSGVDWDYEGKLCSKGSYGKGPIGADRRESTPVGFFPVANAFGLFDMHGNLREWCRDTWHENYSGAPDDGTAWVEGGIAQKRVLRGGSWNVGPASCRSAARSSFNAETSLYDIGFRVACSL